MEATTRARTSGPYPPRMLDLLPETAVVADGELALGGVRTGELADEFGTPLFVYCEATLQTQARAYRAAAPDALVAYGTKAFPNLALLRLFAEEGLGADVSTLGELTLALRAGISGERLVVHGNNKSDEELAGRSRSGRRPRRARLARRGGARRRRRRSPRARPRHLGDRGRHARGDPHRAPRLEVRAPARRGPAGDRRPPPRRGSTSPACTSTSARSCWTRPRRE